MVPKQPVAAVVCRTFRRKVQRFREPPSTQPSVGPSYWRPSTDDGVYATDLRPIIRPDAGHAGAFLEGTFVSAGFGFYSVSAVYRFWRDGAFGVTARERECGSRHQAAIRSRIHR